MSFRKIFIKLLLSLNFSYSKKQIKNICKMFRFFTSRSASSSSLALCSTNAVKTTSSSFLLFSATRFASNNNNNNQQTPTASFTREIGGNKSQAANAATNKRGGVESIDEWDLLDDDVDYWGHLFDEMEEGSFDTPDFVNPEEMKAFLGQEFLEGAGNNAGEAGKSKNKK